MKALGSTSFMTLVSSGSCLRLMRMRRTFFSFLVYQPWAFSTVTPRFMFEMIWSAISAYLSEKTRSW